MQASRGFLVSGQAQHGFSFLPSGPTPERETVFQIRIGSEAKSVPQKMKKFNFSRVLCWAGGFIWSLNALCMGLKVHKNENFFGFDFEFCTISLPVMLIA
jgi:hypothetical protein